MMDEPSVLDYLKAKLTPWRRQPTPFPQAEEVTEDQPHKAQQTILKAPAAVGEDVIGVGRKAAKKPATLTRSWRSWLAVALGLAAQLTLAPGPDRTWQVGAGLYALAVASLGWAYYRREWGDADEPHSEDHSQAGSQKLLYHSAAFFASLPLAVIAFLALGGNRFTTLNLVLWGAAVVAFIYAFWEPMPESRRWLPRVLAFISRPDWKFVVSRSSLLAFVTIALVIFFRLYRLNQVPPEMVSDHAEKLLDVWDVLHGRTAIFFPRNTGREGMQMYLTAAIIQLLGTGYSFLSLKIGTVLAGLLTLPFIYLLGVEFGNRRAGWLALLLAGIAYWPNVISRVGLRFPLYPLFVAPTLYFLLRGLQRGTRNDFILAGLSLGIGLHGYTPIRILPLVVLVAVGLYILHPRSSNQRQRALTGLVLVGLVSLLIFLPLLRFSLEDPQMFAYRSFSRLGTLERQLPGSPGMLFLGNLWRAVTMFAWDNGEIWVHSVVHRPALDTVSAAFFYLGVVFLLLRYARRRNWLDLFWLLAVPLLQLPSILSLAFPAENPSLNRMGGAIIPVFLIVAFAMDAFMTAIQRRMQGRQLRAGVWLVAVLLLGWAAFENYDLVFNQYQHDYRSASWNTSEMGEVIREFAQGLGGTGENAYVVAYPYWVDTRLVGMNAGYPRRDFAIWPEAIAETRDIPGNKLFLVKPEDQVGLETLRQVYPAGVEQRYLSRFTGHDFIMFFVLSNS